MSDIFEQDYEENEDISELEDDEIEKSHKYEKEQFVYQGNLCYARIEYSKEGVFVSQGAFSPKKGDKIIIQTRYGKDVAIFMGKINAPIGIKKTEIIKIERIATKEDVARYEEFSVKEAEAFEIFKERAALHKLEMKLIATHFLIDEPKALFFFTSESRVDFRELVKDLVSIFKMRIELRQIGVRDESRIIGGLGICGRPYCCHAISDRLPPVSIKMAKEQGLSLNSMKISGQCGRLLCCLSYENNWYAEARKKLPAEGVHIIFEEVGFRITDVNPLTQTITMLGEDGRLLEIPAKRFIRENGKWKIV